MNSGAQAAQIALEAARGRGTYFTALSQEMCWDAVALCQARDPGRGVSIIDREVRSAWELGSIPEGASIGFFDRGVLVHEMISVGNGYACGNKNACIGYGSPIGWEQLNLRDGWDSGSNKFGRRRLEVRYHVI